MARQRSSDSLQVSTQPLYSASSAPTGFHPWPRPLSFSFLSFFSCCQEDISSFHNDFFLCMFRSQSFNWTKLQSFQLFFYYILSFFFFTASLSFRNLFFSLSESLCSCFSSFHSFVLLSFMSVLLVFGNWLMREAKDTQIY